MKTLPDLIKEADEIFATHPSVTFAKGTPLKTDVPVLMAEYARDTAVNTHAELVALVRDFEAHCSHSLLELNQGNAGMVSDVKAARALLARLDSPQT